MASALEKMRDLVDSNTVIGSPIYTQDGTTILPISKVSFGFVSGGTDFANKTQTEVGKELGISQVQVSRMEKKILKNLRGKLDVSF